MRRYIQELLAWVLPISLAWMLVIVSVALTFSVRPENSEEAILAVFPPWWTDTEAFIAAAEAGVAIGGFGSFDFLLFVVPSDAEQLRQLQASGVVFLLNAAAARFCGWTGG